MSARPLLLVVYDTGSLPPTRIAEAAGRTGCELAFVVADSAHTRQLMPVLRMLGSVVELSNDLDAEFVSLLRGYGPAGIVTFSEFHIGVTARLADALDLPYHLPSDVDAITRKDRQRQRFAEAGIDSPPFRVLTGPAEIEAAMADVRLPAIIKPVVGASSRNTTLVHTDADCHAALTTMLGAAGQPDELVESAVILEQLLIGRPTKSPWGDYIAVDYVASGERIRPLFVTSKFELAPPCRERGGYGGVSVVADAELDEIRELGCRAVRALNIRHGIADVEIKLTAQGPRVIEVNGRLGGWVDDLAVRSASGDPAEVAIRSALGWDHDTADRPPSGPIAYHYLVVPPMGARHVRSIHDVTAIRRMAHVDRISVLTRPGASVDWRLGARSSVAAVRGTTRTFAQLADTVAEIEDTDWIDYR